MTKGTKLRKPVVKLTGRDGNVFAIISKVCEALRRANYSSEDIKRFQDEATSGDYSRSASPWGCPGGTSGRRDGVLALIQESAMDPAPTSWNTIGAPRQSCLPCRGLSCH